MGAMTGAVPPRGRPAYNGRMRPLALFAFLALIVAGCGDAPTSEGPAANEASAGRSPKPTRRCRTRSASDWRRTWVRSSSRSTTRTRPSPPPTRPLRRREQVRRHLLLPAARTKSATGRGFVQGGIRHSARRSFPPIAHEPSTKTGLEHVDGTVSMARAASAGRWGTSSSSSAGRCRRWTPGRAARASPPSAGREGMERRPPNPRRTDRRQCRTGPMRGQMIEKPCASSAPVGSDSAEPLQRANCTRSHKLP